MVVFGIATPIVIAQLRAPIPNSHRLSDHKKKKINAVKKNRRKKKSGEHERNRERVASEHETATRRWHGRAGREQ